MLGNPGRHAVLFKESIRMLTKLLLIISSQNDGSFVNKALSKRLQRGKVCFSDTGLPCSPRETSSLCVNSAF